jgi:hypothetical protein
MSVTGLLCFLGIFAVLGTCGYRTSYAAGRAFSDDFESGNVNKWSADTPRALCKVVQTARDGGSPHGGSNMLECNWNGTVAWNDPNAFSTVQLPQKVWPYTNEFLVRAWVRLDADVSHAFGSKLMRLDPNDMLDSFILDAQMNQAAGPALITWELINGAQGPESWGDGTALGDHKWHKIEIYMNARSTPTGTARVWIDGTLRLEVKNAVTVAPGHTWGPLILTSNWSNNPGWEHGANNHIYWDDIEVYTDSGSGASGNMADASVTAISGGAPSAPRSVSVN